MCFIKYNGHWDHPGWTLRPSRMGTFRIKMFDTNSLIEFILSENTFYKIDHKINLLDSIQSFYYT